MKRNILHILLALSILVLTPNAYADGTRDKKDKKSARTKTEKLANRIHSTMDSKLELENWMVNINEFSSEEMFYEKELALEDWQVHAASFNTEMALDKKMELKEWMMEPFEIEELEMELEFEDWMVKPFISKDEDNFQEEELVLEDWMLKF
jgi:hypothetical protein